MSFNLFNMSNTSSQGLNPLFLTYKNQIDTNKDNKISEEEIRLFEESHPEVDSSIFSQIESISNNDDSNMDTFEKRAYINTDGMKGMDLKSFSNLSKANVDESSNDFWNGLSEFDLDKLFGLMDTQKDGILSEEELGALTSIDGNKDNLSLFDLQQLIDTLGIEELQPKETNKAPIARKHKDSGSKSKDVPTVDTKTQLTNNLNDSIKNFSTAKSNYESVLDGNIKDNSVNSKKEEMDSAYNAWQEALSSEDMSLSKNISTTTTEIQEVNNKLSQNEKDIFSNEVDLENWTTAYEVAKNYTSSLTSKKSELQSARSGLDSSNEADAEKISRYDEQIRKIESDIVKAKATEEQAKTSKEKADKKLKESKEERKTIEGTLAEKEAILNDYIAQSSQLSPEIAQLQATYQEKKNAYETALNEYKDNLKNDAMAKNEKVNTDQKALSEYTNEKSLKEYDRGLLNYDENFAEVLNKYLLAGASDNSKSDCGGAVRRALNKALKELYPEAASLFAEGKGVIGADWDNQYMKDSPFFVDITEMYSSQEIEKMIENGELKGAIINYEKYSGGKSGHVEGVTTKGLTSDYTRPFDYFRSGSSLGKADYNVYLPVTPTKEQVEEYIQTLNSRLSSYDSPIL